MVSVELRPMGRRALLAEVATLDDVLSLHAALVAEPPPGVVDLVPAARTVLVTVDERLALAAARAWIERTAASATVSARADGPLVDVRVRYDGADLAATAELLGLSPEALAARHRAASWRVAFTGFAPGFAYLVADDWPFDVPRLPSPRTRVPAGAVGLAGGFSGAYPRETPGGWRLIATTDDTLFDPSGEGRVLLPPGSRVRYVEAPRDAPPPLSPTPARVASPRAGMRVRAAGAVSTVQDLGRPGRAALGIARSGALDRAALRRANRLLGNPEGVAAIEVALGGFVAVAERDLWIAVSGAFGPARIDGRPIDRNVATRWPEGAELHLDWFEAGARAYLAVRGGVDAAPAAGARATDTLAGLGPAPLAAGDRLPVGPEPSASVPALDLAPWSAPPRSFDIELTAGPRADWFAPEARRLLVEGEWTVGTDSDRVGMRLDGPPLPRIREGELASEGTVPGALQVPPSGRPTILLADAPVTGGYPVIAVAASLDALAQAAPGARLRFHLR